MEYLNKLNEFGNYLLSINNDDSKKVFINDILIKCKYNEALINIKLMNYVAIYFFVGSIALFLFILFIDKLIQKKKNSYGQ